jgi:hypothetical protein
MEDHIQSNIKLARRRVITSIAFLVQSIANKHTSKSPRFQLSSQTFMKMYISYTSKNFRR